MGIRRVKGSGLGLRVVGLGFRECQAGLTLLEPRALGSKGGVYYKYKDGGIPLGFREYLIMI